MTGVKCRWCTEKHPNPIRLRAHIREEHPEHAGKVDYHSKLITPARGPRPGGSLKREDDAWPARP